MQVSDLLKSMKSKGVTASFRGGVLAIKSIPSWADYALIEENLDALMLVAIAREVLSVRAEPIDRGNSTSCPFCAHFSLHQCGRKGSPYNKTFRMPRHIISIGCEHFSPAEVYF